MSIDEAIEHAIEVAIEQSSIATELLIGGCDASKYIECKEAHEQIAEWLEELKMYKSLSPMELVSEKQKNDRTIEYNKGFDYGFKTGYNKAIDDLLGGMNQITYNLQDADELFEKICDLAELLKVGEQNE